MGSVASPVVAMSVDKFDELYKKYYSVLERIIVKKIYPKVVIN